MLVITWPSGSNRISGWPWWATHVAEAVLKRPERGSSLPYAPEPIQCGSRPAAPEPSDRPASPPAGLGSPDLSAVRPDGNPPKPGCGSPPDGSQEPDLSGRQHGGRPLTCDRRPERPP